MTIVQPLAHIGRIHVAYKQSVQKLDDGSDEAAIFELERERYR
jgi:hypothetical protein